jgi:filamentous hemagglutinin
MTLVGAATGAVGGGTQGAASGANQAFAGVTNNFLNHVDRAERDRLRAKKQPGEELTPEENARLVQLEGDDQLSDGLLERYRRGETLTATEWSDLNAYLARYDSREGEQATLDLIQNGPTPDYDYPYAGSKDMQLAYMDRLAKARELPGLISLLMGREQTPDEKAYLEARTQAGLYWNTAPNESFYPSAMALRPFFNEIDAMSNSSLAALGYLGAIIADADPETRHNLTMTLNSLSDIGSSFVLPRIGLGPVFGETVAVVKAGEITGASAPTVKPGGTIELFTDARGTQIPGALGVGTKDASAVAADARNMTNIPTGSQARVIASNPYIPELASTGGMMDFLSEAARITQSGGEIIINGTARNPFFNSIPTVQQLEALGLDISYQGKLLPEFKGMSFVTTEGRPIRADSMNSVIFIKK